MKYSDRKQREQAKSRFNDAMYDFNVVCTVLEEEGVSITTDDYNQLARQMNKLTNTLVRIKERSDLRK